MGLELWTVRTDLKKDLKHTVAAVAAMGFQAVEFFSTYLDWPLAEARDVRALLDDLGLACSSTHNGLRAFTSQALGKTVELNHVLGSPYAIVASVPPVSGLEGWKQVSGQLTDVAERLRPYGLSTGYHNNQQEWVPQDGHLPMDVVALGTPPDVVLQFDVGPAVERGVDPVRWIEAYPGRTRSLHLRDWSAKEGFRVVFGDGDCPWREIFDAAERIGGVECYLIEHGHSTPDEEVDFAVRGLANFRRLRP